MGKTGSISRKGLKKVNSLIVKHHGFDSKAWRDDCIRKANCFRWFFILLHKDLNLKNS